jgi:hypothetical protein
VAGVFTEDYLTNMDKYAEDESFNFQNEADKIAEEYGLTGLGEQEFYKQINSISETTKARFGELKNAHMVREHKAETITDQVQHASNSTWTAERWEEATKAGTVKENESILLGVVTQLQAKNPAEAQKLIELYEDGGVKIGNGAVSDEFVDQLYNAAASEDARQKEIDKVIETKRNDSIATLQESVSNAIITGQPIPESGEIKFTNSFTMTVDLSEAKTALDVSNAVIDAVRKIPEDDKTISNTTRTNVINKFAGEIYNEQLRITTQRTNAGVNVASSQFMDFLAVKDSEGNTVYEGMDTELARANQTQEWLEELNPIIDAIYADPELEPAQKDAKAKMARMTFVAEKKTAHDQFILDKEDSIKSLRFEDETEGDQEGKYQGILDNFYASTSDNADVKDALKDGQTYLEQARVFDAETDRLREEIRNRKMTDKEIASGMTSEQLYQKKIKEAKNLNADRAALLQADLAVDDKLDGRTKDSQQPEAATATQDELNKNLEKANVVINEKGITGFADKKEGGIKNRKSDPVWSNGIKTKNLIQDITTPRGEGNVLNQGMIDSYNANMMVARINDPEVTTMHEAHQHNAIAYQSGEEMGITPVDAMRDHDKVGAKMVGNFIQGETVIRAARDGVAGISINELESGDLKGVKFNPTTLVQSATPILPFGLLNKAFLDSDNLTPQEEQQVRDYADALYDMSEQDEAGREEIINEMVKLQVNAYAQIGFRFAK